MKKKICKRYIKFTIKNIYFILIEYSCAIFLKKICILNLCRNIHKIIVNITMKALIFFKDNNIIG